MTKQRSGPPREYLSLLRRMQRGSVVEVSGQFQPGIRGQRLAKKSPGGFVIQNQCEKPIVSLWVSAVSDKAVLGARRAEPACIRDPANWNIWRREA
jgi:hypothetical protein